MSQPNAPSTEFETLTAAHIEQYRPPTGALAHPDSVTLTDPYDIDTPERVEARLAVKHRLDPVEITLIGMLAYLAATMCTALGILSVEEMSGMLVAPPGSHSRMALLLSLSSLGPLATTLHWTARNKKADSWGPLAAPLRQVSVPADVGAAYRAFRKAPAQLRAASAGEDIVGVVEARTGHMEDLLVEAARLHALGADVTEDGLAVREQMVTHAAKAQSLVVLAQRKAVAIADADAGTALVLGRGADDDAFEQAGAQLAEDTTFVRGVLNPTGVLIPAPTREIV